MRNFQQGFVAIFMVTIVGFMAILFMVMAMPRSWLQARNVGEFRDGIEARLDAFSCVHIARQKLAEQPVESSPDEHEMIGTYYTGSGECQIVDVRRHSGNLFVETRANKNGILVSLEAALD